MKLGVLGSGMVGTAIATKLLRLGYAVMMGSRRADNPKAQAWVQREGRGALQSSFEDAAAFGEMLFNCTQGTGSIEALRQAGTEQLGSKILVDIANILPPDPSRVESLGEEIQRTFPHARVVKTLNTINCELMVNPQKLPGDHAVFLSGDDAEAKKGVRALLESFGWRDVIDLGGISTARGTEAYLALWLATWKSLGTLNFNVALIR